jgi:hypothetical protein
MHRNADLYRGITLFERRLGRARRSVKSVGADLVEHLVGDLEKAGYIDRSARGSRLARWVSAQVEEGEPNHALLGAWYLHHLCASVERTDVVKAAVRAILLHSAPTEAIHVDEDPVAVLLVLCDELFEWEPYNRAIPSPNAISRSFHAMAVDVQAYPTRMKTLVISGLSIQATSEGGLQATLTRAPGDARWPTFKVRLKHPEYLEVPVYRTWLTMAQNLGRIQPSALGFAPAVVVKSEVPHGVPSTRRLLHSVAHDLLLPFRGGLERWLAEEDRFWLAGDERSESVTLTPSTPPLYAGDIRAFLPELSRDVDQLVGSRMQYASPQRR